jgi:hypothetical protein
MKITCANFQNSVPLSTPTRDQVLIALLADCCLTEGNSSIDLPEVAILWFIDNLVRACNQVLHKQGSVHSFRDFYGEYEVSLRSVEETCAVINIETGDASLSGTLDLREIHNDIRSILRLAENNVEGLSGCAAFKSVMVEWSEIAPTITHPPSDSPPR